MRSVIARARRIVRRARRRLRGGRYIFVYHRVATPALDPWGLAVSPANFAEHLDVLRAGGDLLTVGQLASPAGRAGSGPRPRFAVSFDDGYADNLHMVKPLLERRDVPATVFLCPALLSGRGSYWWDALLHILMAPVALPVQLTMELGAERITADLGDGAQAAPRLDDRDWYYSKPPPSPRHSLYLELWQMIQPLSHSEQQMALASLADWACVDLPAVSEDRPLSVAEASALADGGLIEIGAHTMTHPCLPLISAGRRRTEIEGSKTACSEIAGREVTSFAYPFGKHCAEAAIEVAQAGFACACTTAAGAVEPATDSFLLPRIHVRDCDGAEFERRLSQWLAL